MNRAEIKKAYLKSVRQYIECFQFAHDIDLEYVDSSDLDGVLFVSDMYIDFSVIRYCVDNNVYWQVLSDWYYFALDHNNRINLQSYRKLRADYEYKLGFKKFENKDFEQWLLKTLNNGNINEKTDII